MLDRGEDEVELPGAMALERIARRCPPRFGGLQPVRPGTRVSRGQRDVEAGVEAHRDGLRGDPLRPRQDLRIGRELDARLLPQLADRAGDVGGLLVTRIFRIHRAAGKDPHPWHEAGFRASPQQEDLHATIPVLAAATQQDQRGGCARLSDHAYGPYPSTPCTRCTPARLWLAFRREPEESGGRLARNAALACALLAVPGFAAASSDRVAEFRVGAATVSFTPPRAGEIKRDQADCDSSGTLDGSRKFAFEEPYKDQQESGHFDPGDPYLDCNENGRWDGNLLGGGSDAPRFYDRVADKIGARAMVVSNGKRTIAVEVLDNEGAFNVYLQRIRRQVAADGVDLDGIYISSNHDESAPDTIGISGVNQLTSSVNAYFADYMVRQSAKAIENAVANRRRARIRYAEAIEPENLRQCWSSYPFVDDQLMPSLQAVDRHGHAIATLANVSQHAESLGFSPDEAQKRWISADWIGFFRTRLEHRFGGVAIEMAGSVGSVETPEVFSKALSRIPHQFIDESHPAGCRTLFDPNGEMTPVGYEEETKALGRSLAGAVGRALSRRARTSRSNALWGTRADICIPLTNTLFRVGAHLGVFAERPGYSDNCMQRFPVAPNGTTSGDEVKSQVAAFRIGDGTFISVPGEVFPFTYLRSFMGPDDMPKPELPLPPWVVRHMHTPFRFVDGLGEDMVGYIFPQGNGVGVPGEDPGASDTDRFGCGHSDDSEAASSQTGDITGRALVDILDTKFGKPERVVHVRYVLPDGARSRDPLGGPEIKCDMDTEFDFAGRAKRIWIPGRGTLNPAAWMSLDGRRQGKPTRNTRGYFTKRGERVWLDVFKPLGGSR